MGQFDEALRGRRLYVGTHRRAQRADPEDIAFGIYEFEANDGLLTGGNLVETPQPGWIAAHPNTQVLYATNEVRELDGKAGGSVSAFAIEPHKGSLSLLNTRRTPPLPCHCEVDAGGRFLLVATFGGGSVHLFPLMPDGRLAPEADAHRHTGSSVHPRRQTEPHAHAVAIDPRNCFVLVPDLGIDQVLVYELDAARLKLIPRPEQGICLPPGSGPRHLTFGGGGTHAYLMNEMSATISVFAYTSATGGLTPIQTADLLPEGFAGHRSGAAIALHPHGRTLYATTRSRTSSGLPPKPGLDSLVWFDLDGETGRIELKGSISSGGEIPRSFTFDNSGEYLFVGHQGSGTLVTFRLDPLTGRPHPTGQVVQTPVPVCLRLL